MKADGPHLGVESLILHEAGPAEIVDPISDDIVEYAFRSSQDGTEQTFLCKDYRSSLSEEAPLLVIYLHGALAHQDQGMTAKIFRGTFEEIAVELRRRSAVYLCPELRGGSWMGPLAEADLLQLIGLAREHFKPKAVILVGGSMGGTSALIFSSRHGTQVDGVIAFCPASDISEMFSQFGDQLHISYGGSPDEVPTEYEQRSVRRHPGDLSSLPVVIVHGTHDLVIPVSHSRLLVQRLVALGACVHYTEIEGGNHDDPLSEPFSRLIDLAMKPDKSKISCSIQ